MYPFSRLAASHRSDWQPSTLTYYELTRNSRTASPTTTMNNRRLISTDSNMGISFLSTKELSVKEREKGEHDADHSRRKELRRGSCRKPLRVVVADQHQDQEYHGQQGKNELTHGSFLSHLALARHGPDEDKHECEHGDKGKNLECQSNICHDGKILSLSSRDR